MAATRLTKSLRDKIHNALMERAYVEQKEEVARMAHALGMAVYNDKYSAETQALMRNLPDTFFYKNTTIFAAFNNDYYHLPLQQPVPTGYLHARNWCALDNYPENHELTKAFKTFRKAKEEYENDRNRLSAESFAILQGCPTVKKLVETWPDIKPILEKLNIQTNQSKEVHLPAVLQDMNALFRLAPEDVEGDNTLALAA
jgi:hypothetical protein